MSKEGSQKIPKGRVLVTGASGLLGRQILKCLDDGDWKVRGLSISRCHGKLSRCDLTSPEDIDRQFTEFEPDIVIHAAAQRNPKLVHQQPSETNALNVGATASLAAACKKYNAWLIYISTDWVFDGTKPPYAVDAAPNPLSLYGAQKLEGEQIIFREAPSSAVLRIPLLYGPVEYLKESTVTSMYEELQKGLKSADHTWKRYPTYTCDVARVIVKMLEAHCTGTQLQGIFHWQADECLTKYEMLKILCEVEGLDMSTIVADTSIPKFPRPENSCLDCSRIIKEINIDPVCFQTPFQDALRASIVDFRSSGTHKRPRSPKKEGTCIKKTVLEKSKSADAILLCDVGDEQQGNNECGMSKLDTFNRRVEVVVC